MMAETLPPPNPIQTISLPPDIPVPPLTRKQRVHALRGKYAFVPFSSDDHIRQKELEKQLEERTPPQ
jgi:hypothetical protein